ncbi:hypothetical protein E4T66_18520 [Sinimarinibacterium sp. CAU 1509]|uniref:hypothetical protein n=1 Tax=Sinimarinibacterium sp. CAU 1509 TaxID=2562283 RepID=UPI0010ACC728|nr:hypothetical protein [Sinimarinibacterium sp. CAU 1509]TJY57402.1 hypothetical protein E4T66_18520 [Sinimarinibacterium sp. CAU 1509]
MPHFAPTGTLYVCVNDTERSPQPRSWFTGLLELPSQIVPERLYPARFTLSPTGAALSLDTDPRAGRALPSAQDLFGPHSNGKFCSPTSLGWHFDPLLYTPAWQLTGEPEQCEVFVRRAPLESDRPNHAWFIVLAAFLPGGDAPAAGAYIDLTTGTGIKRPVPESKAQDLMRAMFGTGRPVGRALALPVLKVGDRMVGIGSTVTIEAQDVVAAAFRIWRDDPGCFEHNRMLPQLGDDWAWAAALVEEASRQPHALAMERATFASREARPRAYTPEEFKADLEVQVRAQVRVLMRSAPPA